MVRTMTIDDYEEVSLLWHKIKGFSIRSIDDSREGVARFLTAAWWQWRIPEWWERFCVATTADGDACTMYAWIRSIG